MQFGQSSEFPALSMTPTLTDKALAETLPNWGVLLLESHHSPDFRMEWRTHQFLKIVYVLKGKGQFEFANQSLSFSTGDVIVVPPKAQNRIKDDSNSPSSLYICCLATSLLNFDPYLVDEFEIQRIHAGGHFSNRVASLLRRMAYTQNDIHRLRNVSMVADGLDLVQLVLNQNSKATRTNSRKDAQYHREKMVQYVADLEGEFFESSTIETACKRLDMPRRTFTKLFTELTGETWLQYVRRLAIEHATSRLKESDLPVVSVAFECGFNDLSTFYRQFKSQKGISPAAFRAAHQLKRQ